MNLIDQLDWSYWKRLSDKDKRTLFGQVLMYFVSPLKRITEIELKEYELYGIKCQTFELCIDEEEFVFIPGNRDAILGWNLGTKGLSLLETAPNSPHVKIPERLQTRYNLLDVASLAEYINEKTTSLRKVKIPPMFVQRYPLPAGTDYLGIYNAVNGSFTGEADQFVAFESEIRDLLCPNLSPSESIRWSFPKNLLKENHWYMDLVPNSDCYYVYSHKRHTYTSLRKEIRSQNFDLLTEDQWEYANGAGSRRLFRWGNDLNIHDPYRGKSIRNMMNGQNMFGLFFDTSMERYEITEDPGVLKLTAEQENTGIPIVDKLALSSYYSPDKTLLHEEILSPKEYLYRKAILVKI
ncbi:hypothetical protein NRIC_15640 [Enterococcus florum]|uniref:DUF7278 domain-containing protein n=1 Tax=Enterococcus florum TaxID=2480627 RepID=A0A4P5PK09_9ENTE|nr:hypothetical protein [Enterococcus florum]GCF93673.1 hypothetical protein NRIC_15640 [Enterococcus florum]